MIHIKELNKKSRLRQVKDIYCNVKVGYIGKEYGIKKVEKDAIVLDRKVEGDWFRVGVKHLGLFEVI